MSGNEISIEARLGTSKLEGDAKVANNIISKILGSGQAAAGARPLSAASMNSLPGSAQSYADQMAKQESKAKVAKYSSEPVAGGVGGGGVNTSGTKAFQINRAVINVSAAKINVVGSKSGFGASSPDSVGHGIGGGGDTGGGGGGGSGVYHPSSMFSRRPGENQLERAGRGFMQGSGIGMGMGSHLLNITDAYSLATSGVAGVYHAAKDYRAQRGMATTSTGVGGGHGPSPIPHAVSPTSATHHAETHTNTMSGHREGGSRLSGLLGSAFPVVGAVLGFIAAGAQRLAEAHVSKLTSQLSTIGLVGNQPSGGTGALGNLGYSAAAKGQLISQAQQHMTSADYARSGKTMGREAGFGFSGKFGHAMGIGAGAGMIMSAQLSEMNQANHSRVTGENQLRSIAGYARGFEGGKDSRRLGRIAQFVTGVADRQQTEGGGGDSKAIGAAFSRLGGHGTIGQAEHAISGLSGMMSAGSQSGSPLAGMLMLAQAQRGGSMKDVIKASEKGITGQGIADLKGMIPKDMMEMVMFGQTGKMGQSEHMAQAIFGKEKFSKLPESTMGGTYNQGSQNAANQWAFEMEKMADTKAAQHAAVALRGLHDASMAAAKGISRVVSAFGG